MLISAVIGFGNLPLLMAAQNAGVDMNYVTMETLSLALDKNYLFTLILIPFAVAMIFMFLAIKYVHKSPIKEFFTSRERFQWGRFGFGVVVTLLVMGIGFAIDAFGNENIVWNYKPDSFWMLLTIAIVLVPIQTTCEELVFRSYMFKAFSWLRFPLVTIILCSFGLRHDSHGQSRN